MNQEIIVQREARIRDLCLEIASLKEQLAAREARIIELALALGELCRLKHYKNNHGKTELYLQEQPEAWHGAMSVISDCQDNLSALREHEARLLEEVSAKFSERYADPRLAGMDETVKFLQLEAAARRTK